VKSNVLLEEKSNSHLENILTGATQKSLDNSPFLYKGFKNKLQRSIEK